MEMFILPVYSLTGYIRSSAIPDNEGTWNNFNRPDGLSDRGFHEPRYYSKLNARRF